MFLLKIKTICLSNNYFDYFGRIQFFNELKWNKCVVIGKKMCVDISYNNFAVIEDAQKKPS